MSPFEKMFTIMTKPIVIVLYVALIIASILYFDIPIATYFYQLKLRTNYPYIYYFTHVGLGVLYYPLFLGLAVFFRYIHKNYLWESRSWFLFWSLFIPALISLILKMSLGRARPTLLFQDGAHLYGFYGFKTSAYFWSFPSGHVTTIMSVALGLSILFPRHFYALISLGLAVAFSRVLLTYHYLSDVLFAFYLTVLEIGCLLYVLKRKSLLVAAWKPNYSDSISTEGKLNEFSN